MDKDAIIIERLDGTRYNLQEEGLRVIAFDPPVANNTSTYATIGNYGVMTTNVQFQQLSIPLSFIVESKNVYDYELQRLKVAKIFDSQTMFYVINSRIPYIRWKVRADPFTYLRSNGGPRTQAISLNLVCPDGFAETTVTSLHLFDNGGRNAGFEMDIDNNQLPVYSFHNQKKFSFMNLGRIPLLANERPATITFVGEAPNGITLYNHSTNQSFQYKQPLTKKNELQLVGLIPIVDGKQRLGNKYSSRSFLDYQTGTNQIEVVGSDDFTISFETRFYF
ncbi:phage tail family protein [Weissella minor]|uniref:phage tail domain-containing protein n=1 Tax=Weissella minor TaxID=1620 RepID=UPI001BAEBB6D|nr:phage tail domain-containing protein [Weissella minor]MBS0949514.1 phage tail family protein [Weissella minor]